MSGAEARRGAGARARRGIVAGRSGAGAAGAARSSAPGAGVRRAPRTTGTDWLMSGLLWLAIVVSLGGLSPVLVDVQWWFAGGGIAALVLLAGAVVRMFARHPAWGTVAAAATAVCSITLFFAPGQALLAVIPTPDSVGALNTLWARGLQSIAEQNLPATAVTGIVYLICVGVAAIAVGMDFLAFTVRWPAFTGAMLLPLLVIPSVVARDTNPFYFVLAAVVWLGILLVRRSPGTRQAAAGIGAAALVVALLAPLVLPGVQAGDQVNTSGPGVATGLNPIVTLGDDLRRGDERLAVTYTTSSADGEYLRLAALDDFTGESWLPGGTEVDPGNDVGKIGPVPGLGADVPVQKVQTRVVIGNVLSRWLPVPYAPVSVTGLFGTWGWDAAALSIRTDKSNARGQTYEVASVLVAPSVDQLQAAGTTVEPGLDRYLDIPDDLPPIVASTAKDVVGDAATNYDKAIALQKYFTGGLFTYSEDAPVKQGYDGSGASVLGAFLDKKSGYCVHFSSAMAAMARTLGIPARVAVGFTPGSLVAAGSDQQEYRVTTHDFHAWPELYFAGIGWVRFEPTPGRGIAPAFAPRTVDDPATPADESKPTPAVTPTVAPSSAPTSTPTDATATPNPLGLPDGGSTAAPLSPPLYLLALFVVLAIPFVVRVARRTRRFDAVDHGSALAAWDELRDTAEDLGVPTSDASTPRQLSAELVMGDAARAALGRLRVALEAEAFAEAGAGAGPSPLGASSGAVVSRNADVSRPAAGVGGLGASRAAATPRLPEPTVADLRAVLRGLRREAGMGRRLLAAVAPRSLFAGWLRRLPNPAGAGD